MIFETYWAAGSLETYLGKISSTGKREMVTQFAHNSGYKSGALAAWKAVGLEFEAWLPTVRGSAAADRQG